MHLQVRPLHKQGVMNPRLPVRGPQVLTVFLLGVALLWAVGARAELTGNSLHVPILVYHRFGAVVRDSMTVTTDEFASHLHYLATNGYSVIPARQLVDYRLGKAPPPQSHAVVITADDGHRSVYTDMLPLVVRHRIPVTLFVYPSAISNADYALTWEQLRELQRTGWFDIQSHTYWHPNFRKEKQRLDARAYERFVALQFTKARDTIHRELGVPADMLAWPFGIFDTDLMQWAQAAGYVAGFTLERRAASGRDHIMALPRYLITSADRGKAFERLLSEGRAP